MFFLPRMVLSRVRTIKEYIRTTQRCFVVHPFLFATYPLFHLLAVNVRRSQDLGAVVSTTTLIVLLAALLMSSALFSLLVYAAVRDRHRAGALVSWLWLLLFSYGPFLAIVQGWQIDGVFLGRHRFVLPLWFVVFVGGCWVIMRVRSNAYRYTQRMMVAGGVLVAIAIVQVSIGLMSPQQPQAVVSDRGWLTSVQLSEGARVADQVPPDIYYIISDEHASAKTLRDVFGYTDSTLQDALEQRGFYVATESHSNYPLTLHSLASSLNMQYLDEVRDALGADSRDSNALVEMQHHNVIVQALRALGYQYVYSTNTRIYGHAEADIVLSPVTTLNERFTYALLEQTALHPLLIRPLVRQYARNVRNVITRTIEAVDGVSGPKFVFVHLLLPHPPFVFDSKGGVIDDPKTLAFWALPNRKQAYLDQLIYTDKLLVDLIDGILGRSAQPPIIVLQSDHGSQTLLVTDVLGQWHRDPTPAMLEERLSILNAYSIPQPYATQQLYDSISPVNTFRVVFNALFGATYELLPDRSSFLYPEEPFRFIEVHPAQPEVPSTNP